MEEFARCKNIGELSQALVAAIAKFGPDCKWSGRDDGSLVFYSDRLKPIKEVSIAEYHETETAGRGTFYDGSENYPDPNCQG